MKTDAWLTDGIEQQILKLTKVDQWFHKLEDRVDAIRPGPSQSLHTPYAIDDAKHKLQVVLQRSNDLHNALEDLLHRLKNIELGLSRELDLGKTTGMAA